MKEKKLNDNPKKSQINFDAEFEKLKDLNEKLSTKLKEFDEKLELKSSLDLERTKTMNLVKTIEQKDIESKIIITNLELENNILKAKNEELKQELNLQGSTLKTIKNLLI
eukprot:TRINITY_DN23071_c1_g1_i1.p1 TRINITY_DN23071_c1_g1~~TRINITY_DN23071_c1_g1_i1.p1  ORF type:complete len:129 (-),score=49.43 TRINITY_DN23071_c1_g1_i1:42-371(-)